MTIKLSHLAVFAFVSLSLASVACSTKEAPADLSGASVNAIGDLKAPVTTKCIRTYTGSCDGFKVSCKRSGGKLEGSCPGDNGELFCWSCTK